MGRVVCEERNENEEIFEQCLYSM